MTEASKTAQAILARLGEIRAGKPVPPERRTIPVEDLEQLARAYLAFGGDRGPTLGERGQIFVSRAAAGEFAAAERIPAHEEEAASRELHDLMIDARAASDDESRWRMRKRSTGLDVQARVARQGRLYVVTHVTVRDGNVGGRRG